MSGYRLTSEEREIGRKWQKILAKIRTPKRAEASRRNGKLGGRPKKLKLTDESSRSNL